MAVVTKQKRTKLGEATAQSVWMPKEMWQRVQQQAVREQRTSSQIVRLAVAEYLERKRLVTPGRLRNG